MKQEPLQEDPIDRHEPGGIVLVGLGSGVETGPGALPPQAAVTRQLAGLLQRPVLPLDSQAGPDAALTALAAAAAADGRSWLAALECDVGRPLADGRCWAEALGDWRQPVLLVVPAAQLDCGLPAAATALLRLWRVPLVGLLQWEGSWQAEARRRDGLPWLGRLAEQASGDAAADEDDGGGLVAALTLRCRQLDQA